MRVLLAGGGKGRDGPVVVDFDEPPVVAPHTRRTLSAESRWLGETRLIVLVKDPFERWSRTLDATTEVVDPARDAAKVACLANGDDWGVHGGFAAAEGCERVMRDAGKSCSDARDCEGFCFQVRAIPVSATHVRVLGECSRFRSRFGCHVVIGETDHGLVPRDRRFPSMCVD